MTENPQHPPRPGLAELQRRLLPLLKSSAADGPPVITRENNPLSSYYDSEILTIAWPAGRTQRLLLKYERGDGTSADGLLRVGPGYEAVIYRDVLSRFNVPAPQFFGYLDHPSLSSPVLVLEFLEGVHANRAPHREAAIGRAAGIVGRLHALAAPEVTAGTLPPLNEYHHGLYRHWTERTRTFERRTIAGRSWLPKVLDRIDVVIDILRQTTQTVIHGDYYTDQMIERDGTVSVFDWELTTIGPGELDLASLTNDWHAGVVEVAERSYVAARWPDGAPADFARTLDAARLFLMLRLLGDEAGWPNRSMRRHRVERLRTLAERFAIL